MWPRETWKKVPSSLPLGPQLPILVGLQPKAGGTILQDHVTNQSYDYVIFENQKNLILKLVELWFRIRGLIQPSHENYQSHDL